MADILKKNLGLNVFKTGRMTGRLIDIATELAWLNDHRSR